VEEPAGFSPVCLGRAEGLAFSVWTAEHVRLLGPLHIVTHEQVEETISIEIEPER
jgi:hypothetical protein